MTKRTASKFTYGAALRLHATQSVNAIELYDSLISRGVSSDPLPLVADGGMGKAESLKTFKLLSAHMVRYDPAQPPKRKVVTHHCVQIADIDGSPHVTAEPPFDSISQNDGALYVVHASLREEKFLPDKARLCSAVAYVDESELRIFEDVLSSGIVAKTLELVSAGRRYNQYNMFKIEIPFQEYVGRVSNGLSTRDAIVALSVVKRLFFYREGGRYHPEIQLQAFEHKISGKIDILGHHGLF